MKNLLRITFFTLILMGGGCGDKDSDTQWTTEKCKEHADYGAGYKAKADGSGCELDGQTPPEVAEGQIDKNFCTYQAYSNVLKWENDQCFFKDPGNATSCPAKGGVWAEPNCQAKTPSSALCLALGTPGVKPDQKGCYDKPTFTYYTITNRTNVAFSVKKQPNSFGASGQPITLELTDCVKVEKHIFPILSVKKTNAQSPDELCNRCSVGNYEITGDNTGGYTLNQVESTNQDCQKQL